MTERLRTTSQYPTEEVHRTIRVEYCAQARAIEGRTSDVPGIVVADQRTVDLRPQHLRDTDIGRCDARALSKSGGLAARPERETNVGSPSGHDELSVKAEPPPSDARIGQALRALEAASSPAALAQRMAEAGIDMLLLCDETGRIKRSVSAGDLRQAARSAVSPAHRFGAGGSERSDPPRVPAARHPMGFRRPN